MSLFNGLIYAFILIEIVYYKKNSFKYFPFQLQIFCAKRLQKLESDAYVNWI